MNANKTRAKPSHHKTASNVGGLSPYKSRILDNQIKTAIEQSLQISRENTSKYRKQCEEALIKAIEENNSKHAKENQNKEKIWQTHVEKQFNETCSAYEQKIKELNELLKSKNEESNETEEPEPKRKKTAKKQQPAKKQTMTKNSRFSNFINNN